MSKFAEVTLVTMAEFGLQESELPELKNLSEEEKEWFKYKNLKNLQARNGFGSNVRNAGKAVTISASMDAYYTNEEKLLMIYTENRTSGKIDHL